MLLFYEEGIVKKNVLQNFQFRIRVPLISLN